MATEDRYAPKQYFDALSFPSVKIIVLETQEEESSAPSQVVARLKHAFDNAAKAGNIQPNDEFWILLDTDHRTQGAHVRGTVQALDEARQRGFEIAVSNPSFELWLLLHHVDLPAGMESRPPAAAEVEKLLRDTLGSYNKSKIDPRMFPATSIPPAIRRARRLETIPDNPQGYWPEKTGTRVYRLLEKILSLQ
ncbi:RloB family protein [Geminisphaera colitermitum]|uniref:RloB family protein n=1 Tax=Geminisphaera colitermitum TaxID=1148786 RepID=UPI0012FF2BC0|nr:RloB family protein [Geminisphaera colitermitum]